MIKILKYSFFDLMRSRWSYVYFAFYLLLGFVLLFLNSNISKAVITMMNIIVVLTPMIGTVFGIMYYYSSREFTTLLLAQPIQRKNHISWTISGSCQFTITQSCSWTWHSLCCLWCFPVFRNMEFCIAFGSWCATHVHFCRIGHQYFHFQRK